MKIQKLIPYLLIIFCFTSVIIITLRSAPDDYGICINSTRSLISGETHFYDINNVQFVYPPWSLLIFLPFSFLPIMAGKLIFNILTVTLLCSIAWRYAKPAPLWTYTLALFNLYLILNIILGQFDILILASLTLGWIALERHRPWLLGLALVLVTTKITNVLLPTLVLLYGVSRWPRRDIAHAAIVPICVGLLSFFMAGWDWPIRYLRLMILYSRFFNTYDLAGVFRETTYHESYWQYLTLGTMIVFVILIAFAIFILVRLLYHERNKPQESTLFLAMAINLVASPHALLHHNVYLEPVLARFLAHNRIFGLIILLASFVDLILFYIGIGFSCFSLVTLVIILVPEVNILVKNKRSLLTQ